MKVGWLADRHDPPGGAELTAAEFRAAAPEGVEVVDCPPGGVVPLLDRYVVHNCTQYSAADFCDGRTENEGERVVKYVHDLWPHGEPDLREWLLTTARCVFISPLHRDRFPHTFYATDDFIPPALYLDRFREADKASQGRSGAVCAGAWMNPGKSPHLAQEWAEGNGGITFIGQGPYAPPDSVAVPYDEMPEVLAQFKTFVYLPTALEPFGRTVVEAWAAGCEIVTNRNVGARYWIEEEPEALEAAGENFWNVVLAG